MRQGQQNKRMRGRGRKMSSPLNRVYESNGPDVKIRGSANQIAEKYVTLSRDAHSSGDRVGAENYLQHAEHYFRIVSATQVQSQPQPSQQPPAPSDYPGAELNGVVAAQDGYAASREAADFTDEDEDGAGAPAAGGHKEAAAAEGSAQRPRRRRNPDMRGRSANGSGTTVKADAAEADKSDGGSPARTDDPDASVEESAESVA